MRRIKMLPNKRIDESSVNPPDGYKGVNRFMNWHGFRVEVGSGYYPHLLNELQEKRDNIEACIIVVTGTGGKGKTYFVLRLAEILDPKFDVDLQVPFGPDEFMYLISPESPLGMGRVIIVDESQFAMSSRDWYADIQKDLMKQLEAIRSKGYIIFIVALSESTLDTIARSYVITHKIHLMKRGRARAYTYLMGPFSAKPYPKTLSKDERMQLPSVEICEYPTCLKCKYSGLHKKMWRNRKKWEELNVPICQTIRAKYERKKKNFLAEMATLSNEKRDEKKEGKVAKKMSINDIVIMLRDNPEGLRKNNRGKVESGSAMMVIRKVFGSEINEAKVRSACKELNLIPDFTANLPSVDVPVE
jgi:hypothetical protein